MQQIKSLAEISSQYKALLCDVWGVMHNGVNFYADACLALKQAREAGLAVVMITNSPRPRQGVIQQMAALGVPDDTYDAVVTSGDVTRKLIEEGPRRVFHLGPDRDYPIFDGLDVELVDDFEASAIVCTGLYNDETETPDDYAEMLQRFRSRNLPFICANPDIVVERGDRLLFCAGALARDYGLMGGRTLIAGKPHEPIYAAALKEAEKIREENLARSDVLAIGDGILTDIKGADSAGINALFVTEGIHSREIISQDGADAQKVQAFVTHHGMSPVAFIERLV